MKHDDRVRELADLLVGPVCTHDSEPQQYFIAMGLTPDREWLMVKFSIEEVADRLAMVSVLGRGRVVTMFEDEFDMILEAERRCPTAKVVRTREAMAQERGRHLN